MLTSVPGDEGLKENRQEGNASSGRGAHIRGEGSALGLAIVVLRSLVADVDHDPHPPFLVMKNLERAVDVRLAIL